MTTGRINQVAAVARKVSRTKLGPLLPGLACPHRAAPAPAEGWHKSMGDNFFLRDFSVLFFKQIHSLFVCCRNSTTVRCHDSRRHQERGFKSRTCRGDDQSCTGEAFLTNTKEIRHQLQSPDMRRRRAVATSAFAFFFFFSKAARAIDSYKSSDTDTIQRHAGQESGCKATTDHGPAICHVGYIACLVKHAMLYQL